MSHDFVMDVSRYDGTAILSLRGELDLLCRDELADTAIGLLGEGVLVIADLGGVTFVDSAGLSALVRARKEADRVGGCFQVRSPIESVAHTLRVTGLADWLSG
jgi:anti-anti-sigma factor